MNPFDKLADVFTAASEFVSDSPELAASAHNMSKGEIHELSGVSDQRALEIGYGYDLIKSNPVSYQFAGRLAQRAAETATQPNDHQAHPQQQPQPAAVAESLFDEDDRLAYAAHDGLGFQGKDATVYDFEDRRSRIRDGLSKVFNHEGQEAQADHDAAIVAHNPALYSNEVSDTGVQVTPEMVYNAGVLDQASPTPAPTPEATDSNMIDLAAVRAQIDSTFDETGRTGAASFKVAS